MVSHEGKGSEEMSHQIEPTHFNFIVAGFCSHKHTNLSPLVTMQCTSYRLASKKNEGFCSSLLHQKLNKCMHLLTSRVFLASVLFLELLNLSNTNCCKKKSVKLLKGIKNQVLKFNIWMLWSAKTKQLFLCRKKKKKPTSVRLGLTWADICI